MTFSFWTVTVLLMVTLGIYYFIPVRMRQEWLLLISYGFCLTYGKRSFCILLCSTFVSYLFGVILEKIKNKDISQNKRLICLWCGIFLCVLPLGLGKIGACSFFAGIGTSFYLLQAIGYLVDIYTGKTCAEKNLIYYALFIAFFPKLISGPIEKSANLLRQIRLEQVASFDYDNVKNGLFLLLWGFFQKSVIADGLAVYVSDVYEQWNGYSGGTLCLATIMFAFQLYADFAGYTNIALGAAQTLGFQLQKNFEQPYLSSSIKEFWRRWHMSLSFWLRDYIYIPLGGSHKGNMRQYLNLMITFIVSGLWHGSGLNFLAWGMIHGVFQVTESVFAKLQKKTNTGTPLGKVVKKVWVFILVDIAWIFFRASGLRTALKIVYKIFFGFSLYKIKDDLFLSLHLSGIQIIIGALGIILLLAVDLVHEKGISIRFVVGKSPIIIRWLIYLVMVLALTFVGVRSWGEEVSNFIYMQF